MQAAEADKAGTAGPRRRRNRNERSPRRRPRRSRQWKRPALRVRIVMRRETNLHDASLVQRSGLSGHAAARAAQPDGGAGTARRVVPPPQRARTGPRHFSGRGIFRHDRFSAAAGCRIWPRKCRGCLKHLDEDDQDFVAWLLVRFQIENAKILLRGFLNHAPLEILQPHLVQLPTGLALDAVALLAAKSLEEFVGLLPAGSPRNRLHAVVASQREPPAFRARSRAGRRLFSGIAGAKQPASGTANRKSSSRWFARKRTYFNSCSLCAANFILVSRRRLYCHCVFLAAARLRNGSARC